MKIAVSGPWITVIGSPLSNIVLAKTKVVAEASFEESSISRFSGGDVEGALHTMPATDAWKRVKSEGSARIYSGGTNSCVTRSEAAETL
jgi:hypothetical protein